MGNPAVPYCVAQLSETDIDLNVIYTEGYSDSVLDHEGVIGSQWATIVALYRRDLIERLGAFDETLELGDEKEFMWRIVAGAQRPGIVIGDIVALRRNHGTGQLTDRFTPASMGKTTISAMEGFVAWAQRTGRMTPAIARAAYPKLWIALVRVGAHGERRWVDRAIALAAVLERYEPKLVARLGRAAFAKLPQAGFSAVFTAMYVARSGLHAVRNTRRRLGG